MDRKVKAQFRTLSAATDEISRLQKELAAKNTSQPGITTHQSEPVKPAPPQLGDLDDATLKEALNLSNRANDTDMVKALYNEILRRRRPI
jgi:hypothetical protein